jgi:hypothetical protein
MGFIHIVSEVSVAFTFSLSALCTFSHLRERSAPFPPPNFYLSLFIL